MKALTALAGAALVLTTSTVAAQSSKAPAALPRLTENYVRLVAREAYFWAWPMINVYNRRLGFEKVPKPGMMGGIVPVAPPNRLSMLTDYIDPGERIVACPNQDVVYGGGSLALDKSARTQAWLKGRDYVTPDDVQAVAHDCLRHRIALAAGSITATSR